MYLSDKTERITIRFTSDEFDYCVKMAEAFNITPSAFVRKVIDGVMLTQKYCESNMTNTKGADCNDDRKAVEHDFL